MDQWWKDLRKILWAFVLIFGILFIVFVVNQFMTLYQLLNQMHPWLAIIVVGGLVIAISYVLFQLSRQLYLSPKNLILKEDATKEEYDTYLEEVLTLLERNPNLVTMDLRDPTLTKIKRVETAFLSLEEQSRVLIEQNANAIFLTTAISQNGSLDSLMVLFTMVRMIWQIAKIYRTRPSLASLVKLYFQVAGVVLMARSMEDIDLIEGQIEPLISSILGESVASAIPGMVPIANLIVSSLMEGSINSYLTLRVGLITQDYLTNYQPYDRQTIRRSASLEAMKGMGSIIRTNSKMVIKTMGNAVRNASVGTAKRWFNL